MNTNNKKELNDQVDSLDNKSKIKRRHNIQDSQSQQLLQARLRKQLNYSEKTLESHFRNVMSAQEEMYSKMTSDMDNDLKESLKRQTMMRQRNLEGQLEVLKAYYRKNRHLLDDQDKKAFLVYYKNRRDDLNKLERTARYRFKDIEKEGKDAFEGIQDSSSKLLEVINSLNLNSLADGLEQDSQSFTDIKRNLQSTLHYNSKEWKKYSDKVTDIVSKMKNKISRTEVAEITQELSGYGIKNNIDKYTESMSLFTKATGSEVSELENMVRTTNKLKNGSKIITMYGDFVNELKSNKKTKYLMDETSQQDWNEDMNTMSKSIFATVGTNQKLYEKAMKGYMTRNAAGEADDLSGGVNQVLNSIATAKTDELGNLSSQYAGLDAQAIQNMMKKGDFGSAYDAVVKQMTTLAKNGVLTNNSDYAEAFGLDTDEIKKLANGDITYNSYQKNVKNAEGALNSSKGSMEDYIKNDLPVSIGTQVANAWGNSKLGQKLSEFLDTTNLDIGDILTGGAALNTLTNGALTRGATSLLGKIPVIGKLFGGAKDVSSTVTNANNSKGIINAIKGLFSGGGNSATALEVATEGASTASSAGGLTGTLSKVSSFLSNPVIGGALGILSGGIDAFGNVMDTKGGLGSKISAGIGGFLGGNHRGITDKNTGIFGKIMNTAGGVGKGAGIGAMIGSIVPGIGTAIGAGVGAGVGGVASLIGGKNIGEGIEKLSKTISDGSISLGVTFRDKSLELGDTIGKGVSSLGDTLGNLSNNLMSAGSSLIDNLGSLGSSIGSWLGDKWSGVKSFFGFNSNKSSNKKKSTKKNKGFAKGLSFVPFDGFPALLHKGESVLTKAQTSLFGKTKADGGPNIGSFLKNVVSGVLSTNPATAPIYNLFKITKNLSSSLLNKTNSSKNSSTSSSISSSLSKVTSSISKSSKEDALNEKVNKNTKMITELTKSIKNEKNSKDAKRGRQADLAGIATGDYIVKIYDLLRVHFALASILNQNSNSNLLNNMSSMLNTTGTGTGTSSAGSANQENTSTSTNPSITDSGDKFTGSNSDFFDKIRSGAVDTYNKYGVLPSITMAQAALESGWGKSGLTTKANNLFGMKAGSSWKGNTINMKTGEQSANGSRYTTNASFRAYSSWADSIQDHGKLLSGSRYKSVVNAKNYKDAAKALQSSGYATDHNYANSIISMIEKHGLDKLDPKYKVGTPWIPNDQVAVLHKGEMVVPAKNNPYNAGSSNNPINSTNTNTSSTTVSSVDLDPVVDVIKWAVNRIEAKDDEIIKAINSSSGSSTQSSYDTSRDSDIVFSF